MQTNSRYKNQSGSALLITIVLALAVMVAIGGMLALIGSEYGLVHRTYYYGNAIYLAEAGVEEACAMMNHGSNTWASSGWQNLAGNTNYVKTVTNFSAVASSSAIGSYTVQVLGVTNANPVIISTGSVQSVGVFLSNPVSSATNINRAVKATLGKRAIFQWGLLAQSQINMNGNNIEIDSFDSSDPNASDYDYTDGYGTYTASKRKDNGDIASNGGITNTISVGNANVYGHAFTGPGGTVSVGSSGFVAALGSSTNGVIDSSRVSNSMNVDLPAPTLPSDWSSAANLGNMTGSWIINGGSSSPVDFTASRIRISSSSYIKFNSGYTRLYVTGNIGVSGNASIIVADGAKVEIYVAGSTSIAGNGVANNTQRAINFQLYGLGSSSVSVSGNGQLAGVIYAPLAPVTFQGGGSSGDVMGAVVGNTITLGGHVSFHYDESLENNGPTRGYSVVSWQEL